jgi:hypothetical protein
MLALLLRLLWNGDAALTYNEATYAELAKHPTWSSYYPDQLFVRHPPLALLFGFAWDPFAGSEWLLRLPSFVFAALGIVFVWHGVRGAAGDAAAALAAAVLAVGFLVHAYAVQVGMYGMSFAWAALMVWGRLSQRPRVEAVAVCALALTHLFGFLFLALWAWRKPWRTVAAWCWPAALWLVGATVAAVLLNAEGDIMRLGPLGQFLRSGATAGDAVAVTPWVHLAVGGLIVWMLHPLLLVHGWRARRAHPRLWLATAVLVVYFFFSAPFPRYGLVVLPLVVGLGAVAWSRAGLGARAVRRALRARVQSAALMGIALLSIPFGLLYLEHGPDPRAAGDVPGTQAWDEAARVVVAGNGTLVQTSGPTATAYYLQQAGFRVADRGEAPYRIMLAGPRDVEVVRLDAPTDIGPAAVWLVPNHWAGGLARAEALGGTVCAAPTGLWVVALECP